MGIFKQIEDIAQDFCDNYCKFPEIYLSNYKNPDKANEKLWDEKCGSCPFIKL